ncbi:MAG: NmrA family NAD(P)-binding protein [Bifidobacteriaceae bacterium]|jgi:uncharacterized protein YbjT (DUF2867 family)|nr:NmrA family NAD(P)-binding protein [Bifidobacteriaceae bacterium]
MSESTQPLIVVHGGGGAQAAPVVRRLINDGFAVRVVSRQPDRRTYPAGAASVAADLNDAASLTAAYAGATGVYLQLPLEFDPAVAPRQSENALVALARSGVGQVVFNTGLGLTDHAVGSPFVDARATLVQRLPGVVPKTTVTGPEMAYMDNLAMPFSRATIRQGRVEYPLADVAPVAWVSAADVADVASRAFRSSTPPPIRIVRGPAMLTGPELARALEAGLGRPVAWAAITPDRYRELLTPVIGPAAAMGIADAYAHPAPPRPPLPESQVEVGRTTVTVWARGIKWDAD